jgi:hypothetical protein
MCSTCNPSSYCVCGTDDNPNSCGCWQENASYPPPQHCGACGHDPSYTKKDDTADAKNASKGK